MSTEIETAVEEDIDVEDIYLDLIDAVQLRNVNEVSRLIKREPSALVYVDEDSVRKSVAFDYAYNQYKARKNDCERRPNDEQAKQKFEQAKEVLNLITNETTRYAIDEGRTDILQKIDEVHYVGIPSSLRVDGKEVFTRDYMKKNPTVKQWFRELNAKGSKELGEWLAAGGLFKPAVECQKVLQAAQEELAQKDDELFKQYEEYLSSAVTRTSK